MTIAKNVHHVSRNCGKDFQVMGERSYFVQICECFNVGDIHFVGVMLRFTCFLLF